MTVDPERAAHCAACGGAIPPEALTYRLRVELFADPTPPQIDHEDLVADNREEWNRLIEAMSAMDEEQEDEERDKVFERHEFTLCSECRQRYHDQLSDLRGNNPPAEQITADHVAIQIRVFRAMDPARDWVLS